MNQIEALLEVENLFEEFLEQSGRYSADVFKNPATKQLLADAKADDFIMFLGGYEAAKKQFQTLEVPNDL